MTWISWKKRHRGTSKVCRASFFCSKMSLDLPSYSSWQINVQSLLFRKRFTTCIKTCSRFLIKTFTVDDCYSLKVGLAKADSLAFSFRPKIMDPLFFFDLFFLTLRPWAINAKDKTSVRNLLYRPRIDLVRVTDSAVTPRSAVDTTTGVSKLI